MQGGGGTLVSRRQHRSIEAGANFQRSKAVLMPIPDFLGLEEGSYGYPAGLKNQCKVG